MIKERIINSISCKHKYVFIGECGEEDFPRDKIGNIIDDDF